MRSSTISRSISLQNFSYHKIENGGIQELPNSKNWYDCDPSNLRQKTFVSEVYIFHPMTTKTIRKKDPKITASHHAN